MRLTKGMKKALSLALSAAMVITSANIGSLKAQAADADDSTHAYVATVTENALTSVTLDGVDVTSTQEVFNMGTGSDGKFWVTDGDEAKQKLGIGIDFSKVVTLTSGYTTPTIGLTGGTNEYWYGGSVVDSFTGTEESTCGTWDYKSDGTGAAVIATAITDDGSKFILNGSDTLTDELSYTVTVQYYDGSAKPTIDLSNVPDTVTLTQGETLTISAPVVKPNSTRTMIFDGWAYDSSYSAIPGVTCDYDETAGQFKITASSDATVDNVTTPKIYLGVKTDIDGTNYSVGGKDCVLAINKAIVAATPTGPAATATASATSGPATTTTPGATSGPATTTTPVQTAAPTAAPQGNMDSFNVGFNYVNSDSWGDQTWGDNTVDVTGDGKYSVSYTATADTDDIYLLILSTDLYKGSLGDNFSLTPTVVSVASSNYTVDAEGGWCFADQKETNAYRYNIVNPWNGPMTEDGTSLKDSTVTTIDGLGACPVAAGDTITVYFTVAGMNSVNSNATAEPETTTTSKAKVTVKKKTVTVAAGKSTTVGYTALDADGNAVKATVSSANKKVATVKATSKTKVKISVPKKATKGATAKVTLKSAGKKAVITVKVANPVKKVKAAKKSVTVKKGKTAKVTVKVTAQNTKKATTDTVKATSASKKVAKVTKTATSKGKVVVTVKGVKKGTSKLTVKVGKKSVKVTVKVK